MRVELAHVFAINEIDVLVHPSADREVHDMALRVFHGRQNHRSARAEIFIEIGFGNGVIHVEIVSHLELAVVDGELEEGIAVVTANWEAVGDNGCCTTRGILFDN